MQTDERASVVKYAPAIILTVLALGVWGFGHRLYATLLPDLGMAMQLSSAKIEVARAAVAVGYFIMALPTAFISRNFGCKVGALFGLGTFAVGMFLFQPAVEQQSYALVILAAVVIGSGLAIIQITTAPLILFLGPKESAIRRMNFAQAVAPLGGLAGIFLGQHILSVVLSKSATQIGHDLMIPLSSVGVAAIALAFALELAHFPAGAIARSPSKESTWASFLPPLRNQRFRLAVLAQLLSLLAQVIISAFALGYCHSAMPSWTPEVLQNWYLVGLIAFAGGRFLGAGLMYRFDPMALLLISCVGSVVATTLAVFAPGILGVYALAVTCFFLSIQLPTIFAHGLRDLGEQAKTGAAIMMFVAFSGTGVAGLVALLTTTAAVHAIMILPALCFAGTALCVAALRRGDIAERSSPSKQHAPSPRP